MAGLQNCRICPKSIAGGSGLDRCNFAILQFCHSPLVPLQSHCRGPRSGASMTIRMLSVAAAAAALAAMGAACATNQTAAPTAADASQFLATVSDTMKRLSVEQNQAGWVQQNFITDDTEALAARMNQRYADAVGRFAKESARFDKVSVPADQRRELGLLKLALVMVTPSDPKEGEERTTIMARLESTYGRGKWCADAAKPG